ncbi:hypothetical protein [uncultured Nostoc sp.]|uniref:hypothetical protein n=1 Tax=uncultured Nostoc sp. TaxID=340711 RepID=UPI0035C95E47
MNKDNELTEKLNKMLTEPAEKESALNFLRLSNYSKAESIVILKNALGICLLEAQDIIHNSQTWSNVKERDAKINNDFCDFLEGLGSLTSEDT